MPLRSKPTQFLSSRAYPQGSGLQALPQNVNLSPRRFLVEQWAYNPGSPIQAAHYEWKPLYAFPSPGCSGDCFLLTLPELCSMLASGGSWAQALLRIWSYGPHKPVPPGAPPIAPPPGSYLLFGAQGITAPTWLLLFQTAGQCG